MSAAPGEPTPFGEHALLLEVAGTGVAAVVAARLVTVPGVLDVVPAADAVLVTLDPALDLAVAHARIAPLADEATREAAAHPTPGRLIELVVHYDGPDLDEVAAALAVTSAEVVRRHTAVTYRAAFAGFAPGFVYLEGLDPLLELPRRDTPRERVPAGAVAIAAHYSAVYPRPGPGGWHLLGHTRTTLFDLEADPPALISPGDRVRFVPGGAR